jgi:hypothetical protein
MNFWYPNVVSDFFGKIIFLVFFLRLLFRLLVGILVDFAGN